MIKRVINWFIRFLSSWYTFAVLVLIASLGFAGLEFLNNGFGDYFRNCTYFIYLGYSSLLFVPLIIIKFNKIKLFMYLGFILSLIVTWFSPWSELPEYGRTVEKVKIGMTIDEANKIMLKVHSPINSYHRDLYLVEYESAYHSPGDSASSWTNFIVENGKIIEIYFNPVD